MCIYSQEILIQIYFWSHAFFELKHSQAMLERGVCELAYSFFHFILFLDDCQSGTELKPNGECVQCERGYYRSFLEESCQPCPAGYTTTTNGTTSKQLCDISMCHFNVPIKTLNERTEVYFYFCWKQLNYT